MFDSDIEVKPVYRSADAPSPEPEAPGVFPFTRGPYRDMYRGRPWTIRQYAGFASAEESNERYRYLLERGQTGLSVAFDLPTQLGYDSDDGVAEGEVGRTGVAVDSLADMELLLAGIPLDEVSTSMTINAPASLLLLLYELVAEGQGVPGSALRGTVQNDILKEYVARGNYIFPPRPSMRLTTDLFAYCEERIPRWNTISISGYHIREAGSTAAQELAFTLANGIAYCEAAVAAGLAPDEFGARLSFFFNAHNDFFQEVAKFRAARTLWAQIMRDRFGATTEKAQALRFHAQTGGSTLTAQQPENNIVRVAIQALSAVCVGLWAMAVPELAHLAAGYAAADSWATDAHKWLNVPYDCGIAMVRDAAALRAAMAMTAAYLPPSGVRDPMHYSPDGSRRARAVDVWAALAFLGRDGLAGMIAQCCRHAVRMAAALAAAGHEVLNEVELNQVLVSFGDDARTNRVIALVQAGGECWCGGTRWQGRDAMRISVSSWATTESDVDRSLAAILAASTATGLSEGVAG